jgi:microsomal dipeptidase-like Zn-dependent dipeptidase
MFKITKSQVRLLQNLQTLPTLIHETVTREIFNQESISEFRRQNFKRHMQNSVIHP